jgi:ABC-2 type transport system ATP-binding protein
LRVKQEPVDAFLGPNGADKTTALKVIVGLARPTAGRAFIDGSQVGWAAADARMLGVYIEPCGAHPGRSGRDHCARSRPGRAPAERYLR